MSYPQQKETHINPTTRRCNKTLAKGYNVFYEIPSTVEAMNCKVCGSICGVDRNVFGPTGYLSAMSGNYTLHDSFCCHNTEKNWHDLALKLIQERENISSQSVKKLITKDLDRALKQGEAS